MNKLTKKNPRYNRDVLLLLKDKYGFTMHYIRMSIRGDRVSLISDRIRREYEAYCFASEEAIRKQTDQYENQYSTKDL